MIRLATVSSLFASILVTAVVPAATRDKQTTGKKTALVTKPSTRARHTVDPKEGRTKEREEAPKVPKEVSEKESVTSELERGRQRLLAARPSDKKKVCMKPEVVVSAGSEEDKFALARCDGSLAPLAVERLSILARPGGVQKPKGPIEKMAKTKGIQLTSGIRKLDPGLVERVQKLVDHFAKPAHPTKVILVSGYRPASTGSHHASARALDLRLDGVKNEDLVAFCKTLPDTGCGYYPNSVFVHMDVREAGTGKISWIDASGPGETPRYVKNWPLKDEKDGEPALAHVEPNLPPLPKKDAPVVHDEPDVENTDALEAFLSP